MGEMLGYAREVLKKTRLVPRQTVRAGVGAAMTSWNCICNLKLGKLWWKSTTSTWVTPLWLRAWSPYTRSMEKIMSNFRSIIWYSVLIRWSWRDTILLETLPEVILDKSFWKKIPLWLNQELHQCWWNWHHLHYLCHVSYEFPYNLSFLIYYWH